MEIQIKSKFNGWQPSTREKVIDYANWKIRAMTTCKNDVESLAIINKQLKGIKLHLDDIR